MMKSSERSFKLFGDLLPIHLKPQNDELLSSWIIRLAHAHGMKVQTMSRFLFGPEKNIWARDIDKSDLGWLREVMTRVTGATKEQFDLTTLLSFEGMVSEKMNINGISRGIIPLGIFHRARTRPGLMYCPLCLQEDNSPYFRKTWRLAYFTICVRHQVYLEDACHVCRSPIVPHRCDMFGYNVMPTSMLIANCFKCHTSLLKCVPIAADPLSIRLNVTLELALLQGFVHWGENSSLHSILFFDGVRALVAALSSKRSNERLKHLPIFSSLISIQNLKSGNYWEVEPIKVRRAIIEFSANLLEAWPRKFIDLIVECKLRYSDLKGDATSLPFWYDSVLRWNSYDFRPPISMAYAESIAKAVEVHFGTFSGAKARQLSGHDVLSHVPHRHAPPVTDAMCQELLASIDNEILRSKNPKVRAVFLRDKVMFMIGRALSLSIVRLSNLTLKECQALALRAEEPNFARLPVTGEQIRGWVEWYWSTVRPNLHPHTSEIRLFISAKGGRGLKKSIIGLRFGLAVANAGLQKKIPNYYFWKKQRDLAKETLINSSDAVPYGGPT